MTRRPRRDAPLIVDPGALAQDQAHQALTFADAHEWLEFHHVTGGGPSRRRYVITGPGRTRRELRTADVVPYVQALADVNGCGERIPDPPDDESEE